MDELPEQPAILVLSSGFWDDLLPSPFSGRGKEQLTSAFQGAQCNEALDEPVAAPAPLNPSAVMSVPRAAAGAHHPDPKGTCWLRQGSTAVIRCCLQFLSLKRSGQTFQCYSKTASLSFYFFPPISENSLDWSLSQTAV